MVHTKNPSPAWRNPSESLRRFSVKRKSSVLDGKKSQSQGNSTKSPAKGFKSPIKASPRKANPFLRQNVTPSKRIKITEPSPRKMTLRSAEKRPPVLDGEKTPKRGRFLNLSNSTLPLDFSCLADVCASTSKDLIKSKDTFEPTRKLSQIPIDLRPGSRVKITSKKPFPWMTNRAVVAVPVQISKIDSILGKKAVNGIDLELDKGNCLKDLPFMAKLHATSKYFQFPDLTTFNLDTFPRLEAYSRIIVSSRTKVMSLQQLGHHYVENLNSQWCETFEEIFDDWIHGERRSFYLFSHNSSILFTKFTDYENTSSDAISMYESAIWMGQQKHKIVITPTTSGLRQMFRDEGIKFELPLSGKPKSKRKSTDSCMPNDTLTGFNESILEDKENVPKLVEDKGLKSPQKLTKPNLDDLLESPGNEGAMDHDEWLKDIGISPRSTLGFGRHATISDFSLHKTMSNISPDDNLNGSIENSNEAAKSTALITDFESIQKFIKFLMKSKEFRTSVGQQGGLPPTIIATDSFTNCTMKFLEKTSQVVKRQDQGNKLEYVLEMEGGPILPHIPTMLVNFLQSIPNLNVKDNKMKITVSGRHPYLGFNEAIDPESFISHTEFLFDPIENIFEF